MFESLGRGWKMVMASIRMGFEDKRLLLPSIVTVFVNFFFGLLLLGDTSKVMAGGNAMGKHIASNTHHLIQQLDSGQLMHISNAGGMNGFMEQSGVSSFISNIDGQLCWSAALIVAIWWLINRFLEGITTAMVYSHLTEGPGSGKFKIAARAVLDSAPALIWLGVVTFLANTIARGLKNKQATTTSTSFSFGLGFFAGMIQIFWTLAGHLLLPAIVIEGCSFLKALKRADKIASGNLLTIGFGEVGIDQVAIFANTLVCGLGIAAFGYSWASGTLVSMSFLFVAFLWFCLLVFTTAAFMYIRSAFYTCLYVWAIEAEAVSELDRRKVAPPAPLAAALA